MEAMKKAQDIAQEVAGAEFIEIVKDIDILRKKSADTTAKICKKENIFKLLETAMALALDRTHNMNGVGLAAVQIGKHVRAGIIRIGADKEYPGLDLNIINPVIVSKDDLRVFPKEGCLSFPGKFVRTLRFFQITIGFTTDQGKAERRDFSGIEAVVIQHEIDHMDGVVIEDRKLVPTKRTDTKVGRNETCPCGSGKKFKKCCLGKEW